MGFWFSDSPMDRRSRLAIEHNIVNLSKTTTNLTEVLHHLEAEEVFDLFDLSLIKSCTTNSQRCIKIYEIILQKNSLPAFRIFLKTLLKTQNNSLLDILGTGHVNQLLNDRVQHSKPLDQRQRLLGVDEKETSEGSAIVGVMLMGFASSIPLGFFMYMAQTYYGQLTNSLH